MPSTRILPPSISSKPAFLGDEEMAVVRCIGVEVGLGAIDGQLAQQAGLRELVQRVVDRGQGDPAPRDVRFRV